MLKKMTLAILCLFITSSIAFAQGKQVSGVVISSEDNQPVIGASVVVTGTSTGTVTDFDGRFSFEAPSSAQTVKVSYVGMEPQTHKIGTNLRIVLHPSSEALDEVVVVAYGTTTKGSFTGSAGVIDSEQIEKRQVANITNALSGAVAGVQIQSSNGQPGSTAKVLVRGIGSINAGTAPLYIVDGIPYDGDIASINSADIASMTVLKDAASTAMYGSRGANGVIMITTKKGNSGKAVINFDAKLGSNSRSVRNYDVMTSTSQYLETLYKANYNAGVTLEEADPHAYANQTLIGDNENGGTGYQIYTLPEGEMLIGTDGLLNPKASLGYTDGNYYYTPDNWEKNTFSNNMRQEYNLSISGGADKYNYYLSAGYLDDQGVIKGSGFRRISTRLKTDYQVKEWLKVGANLSYTNSDSRYPDEQTNTASSANAFYIANFIAPVYPLYVRDAEGKIMTNQGRKVYDYGDGVSSGFSRTFMSISNPLGDLTYNSTKYLADVFNSTWYAEVNPVDGLTMTARYGLNIDNTRYNDVGNPYFGQSAAYGGTVYQAQMRYYGFNQQYIANYVKSFGSHNLDVLAGYDGYEYRENSVEASGQNMYNPNSGYVSNTIDNRIGYGSSEAYSTEGIIVRANYNYNDTYFANASFRRDASSRFSKENRWGNFFSASAAWIITNEEFMSNTSGWLNNLKLKASFGQQGNDAIGNYYAYLDQYKVTGSDGIFSDGTLVYKGNRDLTWETSTAYNVGLDFSMLDNRLNGSIEYFGRQSNDMLYNKPVAPSLGYSTLPMNVGAMRNSGVELDLNYDIFRNKNLTWNVNFNLTSLSNKIIKLHEDLNGELIDGSRIYKEGESMYRMFLVSWAGVNPETGEAQYWAKDEDGVEFKTADYSVAAATGKKATKNLLPSGYGGFGTSLSFYGVDFSAQLAYQFGGQIYDSGYRTFMHNGFSGGGTNFHKDILGAWTPENTTSEIPRLNTTDKYSYSTSDRFLTSSNYLALNNITLGYTLPKSIVRKAQIENLRFFVIGDNLALLSSRKGLDPRQSYISATTATYTPIRTVTGGLSVTF